MAEGYDVHAAPYYVSSAKELLSLASPSESQVALDLGCRTGNVAFQIAERVGPERLVVGIALAEGMVRLAAKKAAQKGLSYARFLHMDDRDLAFLDSVFDVVASCLGGMRRG